MVGAGEAHQMRAAGVVARETHRLHHRLRAGHVERHLVEAGYLAQAAHIVRHHRMQAAQHRAELGHLDAALGDHRLVGIGAEQVDAVGAGEVVEPVAVQIGQHRARGGLGEAARGEAGAHHAAELEGDAVGAGELQVRQAVAHRRGGRRGAGEALGIDRGQPLEPRLALCGDRVRRAVRAEEACAVIFVEGDHPRDALAPADMAGDRAMLGERQREPLAGGGDTERAAHGASAQQRQGKKRDCHCGRLYCGSGTSL